MQPITVELPEPTVESIDREAAEVGLSRGEYVRTIVDARDDPLGRSEHEREAEKLRSVIDEAWTGTAG